MAIGVPNPVEVPMYALGFASGNAPLSVGGPEMSELDPAITASNTMPPGENPVSM